jgi:hypothetical protein
MDLGIWARSRRINVIAVVTVSVAREHTSALLDVR